MKCLKCGEETVFDVCESCQVEGNITISIKEYNQLLDYKIKATGCYDNLMVEKKKLEKQKKQRNCQIADLKARLKKWETLYRTTLEELHNIKHFLVSKDLHNEYFKLTK